jgi:uncharacterized protein YdeI (YjbR/CyaY-like superfamily)
LNQDDYENFTMNIGKTLYVSDRASWRAWLEANFASEKEIWLVFPAKDSGRPRIEYNDAVEEALAFGWIDSTVKHLDEHSSAQRFSPRRPNSSFSQANIERLKRLVKEGRLHPSLQKTVDKVLGEKFEFPPDIIAAIRKNPQAWENYLSFSPSYQRIRVAYIDGARKRPEEFIKRLNNFIKTAEQNKIIGYGGIEKHY